VPNDAPAAPEPLQLLAVNILALRAKANWSTRALAEHAKVSRFTLQAIEHLRVRTITVDTLDRIAKGLGVRTGSLLGRRPLARRDTETLVGELLATNLARGRSRRDWTQETLGQRSGVSMYVVAHIERQARSPDLRTVERLAAALGVSMEWLLSEPRARLER
jgi:transcriptional regulator with XRE-family HTH domain